MNKLINSLIKATKSILQMKVRKKPFILSHEVNSKCNLRCSFCRNWRNSKEDLNQEEVFRLIKEAKEFGIVLYNIWGTEPLLREDLGRIIDFAKEKSILVSSVTNGVLLKEKAKEINGLDYLTVSVDGIKAHEEIRNVNIEKIWNGIQEAKNQGIDVGINCVINQKNLDEINLLVKKCAEMETPISFEPIYKFDEVNDEEWKEYSITNTEKYKRVIETLKEMKKKGYPIINSITYLNKIKKSNKLINCQNKLPILHIDSEGELKMCRTKNETIGSYKIGLSDLWEDTKEKRQEISNKCPGCLFFGYIESKLINELKLEPIKNAINFA